MKQLKFMIAAAAAIGLAGAAQAGVDFPSDTDKDALGNTGFEGMALTADGASVTTGTDDYFLYTGNVAADNESKIIAGQSGLTKAPRAKGEKFDADVRVLEVNTGTDPLLRTINPVANNDSSAVDVPADTGIYIDTLVQFTVTPAGDTVTPTADDKLMIYLQEVAPVMDGETVVTAGATNLMVKCGKLVIPEGDYDELPPPVLEENTPAMVLRGVDVETNTWYRLTVKSVVVNGALLFTAAINNTDLYTDEALYAGDASNMKYLPSMIQGAENLTIKAVGFAGEGLVDDIVFSTTQDELVLSVDFTFTWDQGEISAVKYTIGTTGEPTDAESGKAITGLNPEDVITITVTPADWYAYIGDTEFNASEESATLTAKPVGGTGDGATSVEKFVEEASSAAVAAGQLGVDNDAFTTAGAAMTDDAKSVLTKGLKWAKNLGQNPSYLNDINFANPNDVKANAYLLNCDPKDVEAIDDQFKFEAFSFEIVDGKPVVDIDGVATSWKVGEDAAVPFNGTPVIKGAATPNGTYGAIDADSKFFKAFLVK